MPHKNLEARKEWRKNYNRDHYAQNKEYYAKKRDAQKKRVRENITILEQRYGIKLSVGEINTLVTAGWGRPRLAEWFKNYKPYKETYIY